MKHPTSITVIVTLVLMSLYAAGCARPQPVVGVVVEDPTPRWIGQRAPGGTVIDGQGKIRRVASLYGDATLVVFRTAGCDEAGASLRDEAPGPGVVVIEVCNHPDGPCPHHGECVLTRADRATRVVSLCDARGLLRRRWGVTTSGAAFLLDDIGIIRAVERPDEIDRLVTQANEIAERVQMDADDDWGS